MIIAYDENGVSKQREATEEEIAYLEEAQAAAQATADEEATDAALRAEQKAGLLERLGITAEEAELLLS